jgi:hypothetical protein
MKAKLKLDTSAIKGFFQEHGEKFVLVAGLLVMLLFIVSIFKQETLPANLQANAIKEIATTAEHNVSITKPPQGELAFTMPAGVAPVEGKKFDPAIVSMMRPGTPFDDPNKRTDPTLFPVLNLQAIGMNGAIELGGNGPEVRVAPRGVGRPLPGRGRQLADPSAPTRSRDASAPTVPRDSSAPTSRGAGRPVGPPGQPSAGRPLAGAATPSKGLPGVTPLAGTPGEADVENEKPLPPEMELPGPPAMGATVEARPFVMVTGAIPFEKQLREYEMRFAHAQKGEAGANQNRMIQQDDRDLPKYVWWRLERVDLASGEEKTIIDFGDLDQIFKDVQEIGKPQVIKGIHPTTSKNEAGYKHLLADMKTWQNNPNEVVPPEYIDAVWLTWPLPPVLLHDWGHEATNPLIPLTSPEAADASGDVKPADGTKPGDASKPTVPDAFSGEMPDASTGPINRQAPMYSRRGDPSAPTRSGSGYAVKVPGGPSGPANRWTVAAEDAPPVPYKLFRFTDFDVQPGHSYRYRVQLVLKNPNYGISADALATPAVKPEPYRDTPWSDASAVANVPPAPRLLAAGIDRPKGKDPKGRVGIMTWDKESAVQLLYKESIDLGAVANFVKKKVEDVIDPSRRMRRDFNSDFVTNAALIDVHGPETVEAKPAKSAAAASRPGAEAASAEVAEPAEMLLLVVGRNGKPDQLVVVSQAADQSALETWEKTHKVPPELDNPPDNAGTPLGPQPRDSSAPTRVPTGGNLLPPSNGRTPRNNSSGGRPTR